ncbi:flavohemoglobin expression-modulating QEGLA motif protein [Gilvimarinus xylanilyticus]|uniref:Flavohemoglobin expression-modulating QEGLA motif protein n=1 Tax=Gilvimarinus xylanilyticus TaxID=2944139 RepID=A0A9X2KVN6_9GAMM|nr:flavohemoglobin expression-modulating QEGLA motif protein [Gilvimarinus xylanilyticus]MCP8898215.1 flavohemoglobin expression-modulating QEGLA motif protein [Gilvimarinus xylanilyticus]
MSSSPQYRDKIKTLSDRLVALQRPIRILDAIKWPASIQDAFLARDGKALPNLGRDYYEHMPLPFDRHQLGEEFARLEIDIVRQLGAADALGQIMRNTAVQYRQVLAMLGCRGTAEFGHYSRLLYGSPADTITGDNKTLLELGQDLCQIFSWPAASHLTPPGARQYDAEFAVEYLAKRMDEYFGKGKVRVELSDEIVSDAAAGGDCIKINSRATFTMQDLNVLEVHEGWVHIGTTLNGREQPYATWLSVGSPRITAIQEGMAVLMETLTFSSFPRRAQKVSDRVVAVNMAENGADFVEVYRFFRERGDSPEASYKVTQRVFRGAPVTGGAAFTKDISYVKGFVENVGFIRSAIAAGAPQMIPMLYLGKVTLEDIPVLYQHYCEGLIKGPTHLPPMFKNLNGLYVWFGFSSSIAGLDNVRVRKHFAHLLRTQ